MALGSQQAKFALAVAEGNSQVEAYLLAFPKASRESARSAAARLMKNPSVNAEVCRLQDAARVSTVLSLQEKRAWLAEVVRKPSADAPKLNDQLRAVEIDSKLAGDFFNDRPDDAVNPFGGMALQVIVNTGKPPTLATVIEVTPTALNN